MNSCIMPKCTIAYLRLGFDRVTEPKISRRYALQYFSTHRLLLCVQSAAPWASAAAVAVAAVAGGDGSAVLLGKKLEPRGTAAVTAGVHEQRVG